MPKLSRACVLLIAFFITVDAELCPLLCLTVQNAAHESSNVPAQPNTCGACSSGLPTVAADPVWRPMALTITDAGPAAIPPPLAPTFDIDHPPRLG